ncbi:MAG: F0F1 ATP synthase subunit delta [Candidatus Kaiserbacteria bacterium]|nr:F0F1 ATP synthase subunit delta [Candidatus Kaiserbacteria bacterium]
MQPNILARTLNDLYRDGTPIDDLLAAIERYLTDLHREALLRPTLIAFARMVKQNSPTVTLAVPHGTELSEQDLQSILERHNLQNRPVQTVTGDLIGGYVLEYDHTRIDRSYRSALLSWYTHCTT